eukprot:2950794-Prymnesium_polylepis.1
MRRSSLVEGCQPGRPLSASAGDRTGVRHQIVGIHAIDAQPTPQPRPRHLWRAHHLQTSRLALLEQADE